MGKDGVFMDHINEEKAQKELEKGYSEAEELLKDKEKIELFLERLEEKLKQIPKLGETLSMLPVLISLVRSYIKKEYNNIPIGSIIAIVSALIYFFTPIDLIPDTIIGAGYIDDAMVLKACLKLIHHDVQEYIAWRDKNLQ